MRIATAILLTAWYATAPQVAVSADKSVAEPRPAQAGAVNRVKTVKQPPAPPASVPDITLKRGWVDTSENEPSGHEATHVIQQPSSAAGEK